MLGGGLPASCRATAIGWILGWWRCGAAAASFSFPLGRRQGYCAGDLFRGVLFSEIQQRGVPDLMANLPEGSGPKIAVFGPLKKGTKEVTAGGP